MSSSTVFFLLCFNDGIFKTTHLSVLSSFLFLSFICKTYLILRLVQSNTRVLQNLANFSFLIFKCQGKNERNGRDTIRDIVKAVAISLLRMYFIYKCIMISHKKNPARRILHMTSDDKSGYEYQLLENCW